MVIDDYVIRFIGPAKPVRPEHLANIEMPSSQREELPIEQGGVPSMLRVVLDPPETEGVQHFGRVTQFLNLGPRPINGGNWSGKTSDHRALDWIKRSSKDGTMDGAIGVR